MRSVQQRSKETEFWQIKATIHGKTFKISVGDGKQRIRWLAHVAIARWDEDNNQGWKYLGTPTFVRYEKKEIDMELIIRDVLKDGDEISIFSSMLPFEDS
jgi:hypothetical protein